MDWLGWTTLECFYEVDDDGSRVQWCLDVHEDGDYRVTHESADPDAPRGCAQYQVIVPRDYAAEFAKMILEREEQEE